MSLTLHVDDRIRSIQVAFAARPFLDGLTPTDVMPLTVLLFLSMLPLHADNPQRQLALLANALRLYADLIACESPSHDRHSHVGAEQPLL